MKKTSFPPETRKYVFLIVILLSVLISYSNSFENSFHYDDYYSILGNDYIKTVSPSEVLKNNNPFRFIGFYSFALNYYFCGFKNLFCWHIVNIILHLGCALLMYLLACNVLNAFSIKGDIEFYGFLSALLFALHPSMSEAVNYIQARHILFLTFFVLSLMNFLILYFLRKDGKYLILSLLFSLLAVFSRETGVFYAAAFSGVIYFFFSKKIKAKRILHFVGIPLFPFLIVFVLFFKKFMHFKLVDFDYFADTSFAFFKYMQFLLPVNIFLNVDHHFVGIVNKGILDYVVWPFLFLCLLFIAIGISKKFPAISFFMLIPFVFYFPYMVIQKSAELLVEYKFYFMFIGYAGLFSVFIVFLSKRFNFFNKYAFFLLFCFYFFLAFQTYNRNKVWKTDISLWSDCVRKNSKNSRGWYNLAKAYYDLGDLKKSYKFVKKSLILNPDNKYALYLAGNISLDEGKIFEAGNYFKKLIDLDKKNADAFLNYGLCLAMQKNYKKAFAFFRKSSELKKCNAEAYYNMGNIYAYRGDLKKALVYYKKAVWCKGDFKEALIELGWIYKKLGNKDKSNLFYSWAKIFSDK